MASDLQQISTLLTEQRLADAVRLSLDAFGEGEPEAVAREVGAALRPLLQAQRTELITAYLKQLQSFVEQDAIAAIRRALDETPAAASDWGEQLLPVTQERLCRECRDAIRAKNFDLASTRARQILALKVGAQGITQRCQLLGTVLGSLENIPRDVDKLWRQVESHWREWKLTDEMRQAVLTARQTRLDSLHKRRYEGGTTEWTRQLTDAAMALRAELPRPSQLGDAEPEDVERFHIAVQGLVQAAIDSPKSIALPDAMWILVEYTPREQTKTATAAGIEQRVHGTLGPRARHAATRALARLVDFEPLRRAVLAAGKRPPFDRYMDLALDLMAALGAPEFADFALGVLRDKGKVAHHAEAVVVVGACGGEGALDLLFDVFKGVCRGKVIDGQERRLAMKTLEAMSRVIQRHDIAGPRRDTLLGKMVALVPKQDTRLCLAVGTWLGAHRTADLAPKHRTWLVAQLIDGLWRPEQRAATAGPVTADQMRNTPLGQRQGMANFLVRLGEAALSPLHEFLMGPDANVNAAYAAAADVLGKIGNASSVPVLEQMLRNVLMVSDAQLQGTQVSREEVWDVEAGQMVALSRPPLIEAITDALQTIGTPEAIAALWNLREQVEMGQIESPGPRAAAILTDLPPRPEGAATASHLDAPAAGPPIAKLMADLKRGGFLGGAKAKVKKIAALQALAQRHAPEAIGSMLDLLGDRDTMIVSAAKTALAAFNSPRAPEMAQVAFVDRVLAELENRKSKIHGQITAMMSEVDIGKEPWASRIDMLMNTDPSGTLRAAIARLQRMQKSEGESESPEGEKSMGKVELKMQYLEARRAWIRGGKQGPPPEPPEGI